MNREIGFNTFNTQAAFSKEGVFTTERASFIVSDDLQVTTNSAGSSIQLLNSLGIKDMAALQEKTCILGLKEIINLLKCSIVSKTPLSDVVLHNKLEKSETFCSVLSDQTIPINSTANSRKMVLKAMVHKSTKKVLFAQAEEDFIDFLFSFPTIPLGSVVSLLSGDTSVPSLDNLYKSISSLSPDKYLKSGDVKTMLIDPKLPPQYLCKNQIFALSEKSSPKLMYKSSFQSEKYSVYLFHGSSPYSTVVYDNKNFTTAASSMDPKLGKKEFVRGPAIFMVTDDLEVTPMSPISSISFLGKLGIPFCDVEEIVLDVGIEEALGILRASLSSSSALTNGLNLASKKQPKQET